MRVLLVIFTFALSVGPALGKPPRLAPTDAGVYVLSHAVSRNTPAALHHASVRPHPSTLR